ncbi:ribonuclease 3-like protein 1 [Corylus avellana]|uniref:ribonuclease 3-like protein 1 n=1 Tax=Corylus avellana TaxID=13451 RepID=UPI00286BC195|nr:ribonuclease 3-like protein 1 [Corylus avellana]
MENNCSPSENFIVKSQTPSPIAQSQVRLKKPRTRPLREAVKRSPKEGAKVVEYDQEPTSRADQNDTVQAQKLMVEDASLDPRECRENTAFQNEGASKKGSAKSHLYEICAANYWKPPLFECCKEEGPSHAKMFTFKVIVEIQEASTTVLECFGAPQLKKKRAAEHAAEGALWYLKHSGYSPKDDQII